MLLPRTCPLCGHAGPAPCRGCARELERAPSLSTPPAVDRCTAVLAYEGAGRELVARLKYRNARSTMQWLAVHMAQQYSGKIRVNAIAPGFFLTQQNHFLLYDEKTSELSPRGQSIIAHTPMGRFGNPNDLFGAVLWLLSDASAFVTGVIVPIDGGFSAYSGV